MKMKMVCAIADKTDANGILIPGEVMAGMEAENIPVTLGFDSNKIIGHARTEFEEGRVLICDMDIMDIKSTVKGLKPAINYQINAFENDGEKTVVKSCELISIGLVKNHAEEGIESI